MLPENFAETFPPERVYISMLLKFFKTHKKYMSKEDISKATGIPQGESSGKVVPHIKYMLGMNLIEQVDDWYKLTSFGKIVCSMDRSLTEEITAWCCHAFMCDNEDGAVLYNRAFQILKPGVEYSDDDFNKILLEGLSSNDTKRILSCFYSFYTKDSSFAKYKILSVNGNKIEFNSAPIKKTFIPLYGAFVCHYLYKYFPERHQISISEFLQSTGFLNWFGLKEHEFKSIIDQLAGSGYVKVSNLVNPPVISPLMEEDDCWSNLYSNII